MIPTSVLPSGVIARPSMPLFAVLPTGVGADLIAADRTLVGRVKLLRQGIRAEPGSGRPGELVNVGTVFIGNEYAFPVGRYADAFGIEAGIIWIAGVPGGIKVVRAPREEVMMCVIDRGRRNLLSTPRRCRTRADHGSTAALCRRGAQST